jgi:hypothetical protein
MKQLILFAFISVCLLSCSSSEDKTPAVATSSDTSVAADKAPAVDKTKEENIAVVNKYLSAIENHDTVTMASLMADNYRGYGPSVGDSAGKQENLENWKYNLDNYFSTIKYNQFQNFAATMTKDDAHPGEWVSNWAYCDIKYKDGRGPIHIWVNSIYKIENGKIARSRVFYNEADWLRQLGYRFVKPPTKQKGASL